jgi:outer membrane autotransporter protein
LEQSGPSLALYNSLLMLSADEARGAFNQLSGEMHASAKTALINESHFVRDAANDRVRQAFGDVAAASMPVLAYGEGGPSFDSGTTAGLAAWGQVFGSWTDIDGDGNAGKLEQSVGGLVTGFDAAVMENSRIGLLAGYSHSSFDVKDRASSGGSDNIHLGLYGGSQWGNLGLRGGLAYTWHDIETNRSVAFPGFTDHLKGDYDAGTFQAFGELGYRMDAGRASFEPFANLAYVNLHTDGFTEEGGAAALTASGQSTDTTFTTVGLRASTDFLIGTAKTTLSGTLAWRHAFGDTTPLSRFAFSGSDAFTIAGAPIAKDTAVLQAGVDVKLSEMATLGLSYNGEFGDGAATNGVDARLGIKF